MSDQLLPDDDQVIEKLAALAPLEYSRERRSAAEERGVSVTALDEAVKRVQRETSDTAAKGREIIVCEPEPWPETINGAEALTEAANHLLRHMMMKEADAHACVLWAAHTYMFEDFSHSPRLCITANTEESGKTVLMTHMVGNLVNKPMPVELMNPAPFFRIIEELHPTFLIDECDVFVRSDSELLAAVNSGWEPHGGVPRCVGENHEPRLFSTFTPTAMAGIELHKKLPATTFGRSIVVQLERAAQDEIKSDDMYNRKKHHAGIHETARKLARFIQDNREVIANHTPTMPEGVVNRLADKWEPLLAIAEVAGGDWPERARMALFRQVDVGEPCRSLELLKHVEKVVDHGEHIHTVDLIDRLCRLEDGPWAEYNYSEWREDKKRIKDRQVSSHLKKFGLKPETINKGGIRKKGYRWEKLQRAFERYLPNRLLPPDLAVTPLPSNDNEVSSDSGTVTSDDGVTGSEALKPSKNAESNGVTEKSGDTPDEEEQEVLTL